MDGILKKRHWQLVLLQEHLEGIVDLGSEVFSEALEGLLANNSSVSEPLAVGSHTTGLDNFALEGGSLDDFALGVADSTTTLQELNLLCSLGISVEVLSLDLDVSEAVGATSSGDSVVLLLKLSHCSKTRLGGWGGKGR